MIEVPEGVHPRAADRPRVSRRALLGGALAVGALTGTAGAVLVVYGSGRHETAPFTPVFTGTGLVTNEYAFQHPHTAGARLSADWVVTSGSLFALHGDGWTGTPDTGPTGPDSARTTDSAVFRLVSRRRDFGAVSVTTRVRLEPPVTTARTPAQDWDGGHLWLRYHSPQELYALSFRRRDGSVLIKRKVPAHDAKAVDGGDYATLAEARHAFPYRSWHKVTASAVNHFGGVRLTLAIDDRPVLAVTDRTPGPLTRPGGVGIRADNTELLFRDFHAGPAAS
ncbi:hypothetical protein RKE30_33995 [Streptomyces sp. Li-HN-5-11]|uniref:hypothetical protein n=1 Tax=Streptomyces sp. Li-HN-5-11 TaxID=3075432 RepID=UPI0028AE8753|nr:hypothetical protein [Streptomyces sp. Li-HN-5-11]WNM35030.1 hypothetical protein RKE30_33995 [Streptomyces sp. Li-HN-5-11]